MDHVSLLVDAMLEHLIMSSHFPILCNPSESYSENIRKRENMKKKIKKQKPDHLQAHRIYDHRIYSRTPIPDQLNAESPAELMFRSNSSELMNQLNVFESI